MATKRITDLDSATEISSADVLHIVQGGTDKQAPASLLVTAEDYDADIGTEDISDVGDGTVKGAIATMNGFLGDADEILNTGYTSTAETEYTSYTLSNPLSDYRFVVVLSGTYGNTHASIFEPTQAFITHTATGNRVVLTGIGLYYATDTTVMVMRSTAYYRCRIYGIK